MTRSASAFAVAVLLTMIKIGSCLQCFECNSVTDYTCTVKVPLNYTNKVVDCTLYGDKKYTNSRNYYEFCRKIVIKDGTTKRECFINYSNHDDCTYLKKTNPDIAFCGSCLKDRCNAAASMTSCLHLAAITLFAVYLYYKQ